MFIHCPICNSAATVPILYGTPDSEMMEANKYGLIYTAGSVLPEIYVDRKCKSCSFEWAFETSPDNRQLMTNLLNRLELELNEHRKYIERTCIDIGRKKPNNKARNLPGVVVNLMHEHHRIWNSFTLKLHTFGNHISIEPNNYSRGSHYSLRDALSVVEKFTHDIYMRYGDLANGCYQLGLASSYGSADDLKNATHMIQGARQSIDFTLQELRHLAFNHQG
jgi:hypothetical protein